MAIPSRKYFTSEGIRVKATPITRRHGVKCRTVDPLNCRLWPKEVGRLVRTQFTGVDWWQNAIVAEFSGGRRVTVATSQLYSTKEALPGPPVWAFEMGFDPEEFVTIPRLI